MADDHRLFEDCLAGRPGAPEAFVARFAPLISWVILDTAASRGRDLGSGEMEDIRQEAYVALFENGSRRLRQFRPGQGRNPASWVGLIARQVALRKLRQVPPAPESLSAAGGMSQPPEVSGETAAELRRVLEALPPREALCLKLLVGEGLPAAEVGEILGVTRQTVQEMKARALSKLKKSLGEQ